MSYVSQVLGWVPSTPKTIASSFNSLLYSSDFSNSAWSKTDSSVAALTSIKDNFGGTNGWTLTDATNSLPSLIEQAVLGSWVTGDLACYSVYVRRGTAAVFTLNCYFTGAASPENDIDCTWDSNTSITMTPTAASLQKGYIVDYGYTVENNEWIRVYCVIQSTGASTSSVFRLWPSSRNIPSTGTLNIDRAQMEFGKTKPGLYAITTSAAAAGGGVIQQNLATYSEDISNAIWGKNNCTAVANQLTANGGGVTLSTVSRTAAGNHFLSHGTTVTTSSTTFTVSVWIMAGTMSGDIVLRLRDGASVEVATLTVTPTSTPTRYSLTANFTAGSAANIISIIDPIDDIGAAGDTFFAGGLQVVKGFVPLDYVSTTSAAANCSAYAMEEGQSYELDSSAGSFVAAFPAWREGAEVSFVDVGGSASSNPITLKQGGGKIMGSNDVFVIDESYRPFNFKCTRLKGWVMR